MKGLKPFSYDRNRFGAVIDYDKYSLILNGRREFIFGGEFHYWRVPDHARWRDVLLHFKTGGVNCVRIYFHWGWHSPDEETYLFHGNRDIDSLLSLCEELGLYVLCAPGPYVCAETSAGGFPGWLLAKREVRLRHVSRTGCKRYDPEFARHSRRWLREFVAIMARHERTTNPRGCVIGLQIENELFRKRAGLRLGLDEQMADLARDAREFGATVPLFHNDAFLFGSWVGGRDPAATPVDLYGFDAYIVWCPQRYCGKHGEPPRWRDRGFARRIDGKERAFRGCGGWNLSTPFFIPELQGGWFNQWKLDHGFDEIYDFYGEDYTKTVVDSFLAQGMSMFSLYMYYGGTNWGTVGDPDVYTSYDYSACIREYGYLSNRLRRLRLTRLFIRSFEPDLLESDPVEPMGIRCSLKGLLVRQRRSSSGVDFYTLRNFNPDRKTGYELALPDGSRASGELRYRASFVAVGNLRVPGFTLKLSTLPWLARMSHAGGELWIFQAGEGELLFEGSGLAACGQAVAAAEGTLTRVKLRGAGQARLESVGGHLIYLLALTEEESLTLTADFESDRLQQAAWGAYKLLFTQGRLEVETTGDSTVHHLGPRPPGGFLATGEAIVPGLSSREFRPGLAPCRDPIATGPWAQFPINWDAAGLAGFFTPIDLRTGKDPLDHGFTSGHVVYRCRFSLSRGPLALKLNIRHRAVVWLNGKCLGGHSTYGLGVLQAGAKNGPDPAWRGSVKYDLSPALRPGEPNELIVLVENLGYNRGPGVLNDFRNPRGILRARFSPRVEEESWEIGGRDVRRLSDPFNTAGLPGEEFGLHEGRGQGWVPLPGLPGLSPDRGLVWYRTTFSWRKDPALRLPLRARLEGCHGVHLFLNGLYVGRYAGELGPQHDFYLMDEALRDGENTLVLAAYTWSLDPFLLRIQPYCIVPASGNLDEAGPVFCTRRETVPL